MPSRHWEERAVDMDEIPFVDACGVCDGNTVVTPQPRDRRQTARLASTPRKDVEGSASVDILPPEAQH
ncbi:hypothetical protein SprV_0100238300 [Sparganum proliferum]